MKRSREFLQQAIDAILPIAANARQELGPDADATFRLGKALHALMQPKRRPRKTADGKAARRIKGRLPDGSPVVLDVTEDMIT